MIRVNYYKIQTTALARHVEVEQSRARLFSFISINWRGRPLTDYQVVVETIAATTTRSGLTVEAVLDINTYPTGVRVPAAQQKAIPLQRYTFHGEWNYIIHSGPIPESLRNKEILLEPTK